MTPRPRAPLWLLIALGVIGHVLLAAGLFAPAITISPRMGQLTRLASLFGALEREETLSIVASTRRLFEGGEVVIATIIALASIVTPLLKLVVVNRALFDTARGAAVTPWLARTSHLTKYSLIDVLVIAILIVCAKSLPGGTTISARWGIYAFSAAAVLPWIIALGLRPGPAEAGAPGVSGPGV